MSCPGCGFFLEGRFPLEEQDDDWYARVDAVLAKHTRVEPSWYYTDNDDVKVEEGCGGTTWSVRKAA